MILKLFLWLNSKEKFLFVRQQNSFVVHSSVLCYYRVCVFEDLIMILSPHCYLIVWSADELLLFEGEVHTN